MSEFSIQLNQNNLLNEEIKTVLDSLSGKISAPDLNSATTNNLENLFQLHDPKSSFISQLITIIVEYFNETSELPPPSILLEHYIENIDIPQLEKLILEEINPRLIKWGVPIYVFNKIKVPNLKQNSQYDPLFILACNKILDQSSTKTFGARIKELRAFGITEATWTGWMNIPSYFEYAKKLAQRQLDTVTELNANLSLAHLIQKEDLSAIKYYHELTGRFKKPLDENTYNLQFMIITLLEILVKHVEPSVIDTIASELEDTPVGQLIKGQT